MKPPVFAVVVALVILDVALPLVPASNTLRLQITTPVSSLEEASTTLLPTGPPLEPDRGSGGRLTVHASRS